MAGFRHLGDREVAALDRIRVVRGRFEAPDGTTFERDVVRTQKVVAMVPLLDDGRVLLVRQYRGPVDRWLFEIPAGLRDVPGEDPLDTAKRELVEEVGRVAGRWEHLAAWYPAAGFSDQYVDLYLASDLSEVEADRQGIEETHMSVEAFDLAGFDAAVATGEIADSKTLIGLLLARDRQR